ncbi:MAG: glycerophosphodiester phosphodiesterase, partial [Anaerolineales bacterium]
LLRSWLMVIGTDAGSHFDVAFRGESIPTLDQVLEAVGRRIYINIELSNYASMTDSLPEKSAYIIKRHNLSEWVMFSSFNPLALIRAKRALPNVPIGLLALSGRSGAWARSWLGRLLRYQALHPHFSDVDDALVEQLHKRDARIHPFTVDTEAEMLRLKNLNVDGVITDDPMLARKILRPADILISGIERSK